MEKVKIAFIGFNKYSHAAPVWETVVRQSDIYEIAGYVLPENEREKFPGYVKLLDGYPELTLEQVWADESITAVLIDTEEIYLTKYALLAAEHGKHIHMEKPGGIEPADFEKLVSIVKANKTVFHVAYMYRYNPYIMDLLARVRAGELGEIVSVEAQMNGIHPDEQREWLNVFPGGMMFFLGCHLIDLILLFQGTPEKVIPLNTRTGKSGIQSEDFGMAVLQYKNGVSFARTNDVEYGGFDRRQLVVIGTKKTVELKPLEMFVGEAGTRLFTGRTEYSDKFWGDRGTYTESPAYDRYELMMESFAKMVRGEMENPYTYDYELEVYRTLMQACGR